jgi:hypothetical protein
MADKRDKVISYRRAVWWIEKPDTITLSMCIAQAIAKLPKLDDRQVPRNGGQELTLAKITPDDDNKGFLLHITLDTPGESASVVPKVAGLVTEIEVGTMPPPNDAEFMDGDACLYVRGNHVCLCTSGCTDATVRYFLAELFKKANIRIDADKFDLMKVADLNKVTMIQKVGVKEITLKGTIYKASAQYAKRKGQPMGMMGEISRIIQSQGSNSTSNEDALSIALTLTLDERRKGIPLGEARLKEIAQNAVESAEGEDDFTIYLKDGQQITATEIYVKSVAPIDAHGKSVLRTSAWAELKAFYARLSHTGTLEA